MTKFVGILMGCALCSHIGSSQAEATVLGGFIAPSMWVTPLSVDFGPVAVGAVSTERQIVISNVGNDFLNNFAGNAVPDPFLGISSCGIGILPGESCVYSMYFLPTAEGAFSNSLTTFTNAGSFVIEVRGEGIGAGIHASPLSLDFGLQSVGTASATQITRVHNYGLSNLEFPSAGSVSSPFSATQDCTAGVLPGDNCGYFFGFAPTSAGSYAATLVAATNAGPISIEVRGQGWQTLRPSVYQAVSPLVLDFGPVGVDTTSATQRVTVRNQSVVASLSGFVGGFVGPPFVISHNCFTVALGGSCQYFITFSPTSVGNSNATSTVTSSAGSFSIQLLGEGVGPELTADVEVLDFGYTGSAAQQTVTITNTGLSRAIIGGGGGSGPFSATHNCFLGLAQGDSCRYNAQFSPTDLGRYAGTLDISTNDGPITIQLIGGLKPPVLEQIFMPSQIDSFARTTLQYRITNPNPGATLFGAGPVDQLPPGLSVSNPLQIFASPECATVFSVSAGDTLLDFAAASIRGMDTCVINIDLQASDEGAYTNSARAESQNSLDGNTSIATLFVGIFGDGFED